MSVGIVGGSVSPSTAYITNAQTGTTYTIVMSDSNNTMVELNNASAITVTVPTNATTAFPVGSQVNLLQTGAGGVTVTGTGTKLRTQYSATALVKTGTDSWTLIGDLSA